MQKQRMKTGKNMRTNMSKRSNSGAQKDTIRFLHINGNNPTVEGHLRAKRQSGVNFYYIPGPSFSYQHKTCMQIVMSVLVG